MIGSATVRPAVQADVSCFEHWLSADAENSWQTKDFVRAIETDNDSLLVVCANSTRLFGVVSQRNPASVAGFILTQRVLDEVTILYLSIDPRYRRQGLARQLVQALQVAVGRQTIMLEVRQSNEPARALYQQCGFMQVGERVNYYRSAKSSSGREAALLLNWQVGE
ncbi:MAG: GNAT family N-acetyltransferase [Pseudomonadales bacterium]|nr:GNAT family N-acetyltransferase [Pseudomonadales bacterium]